MGILSGLISIFTGEKQQQLEATMNLGPAAGLIATIDIPGEQEREALVSSEEIEAVVASYAYVLDSKPAMPKAAGLWFDESVQKRRLKDGSDKVTDWLTPFVPHHLVASPGLNEHHLYGPNSSSGVAKFFRARVRELKKAKQDYEYELLALYGAAVMGSLFTALKFCDVQGAYGHQVAAYVAISDLADIKVDYRQLGYHAMTDLGKTDVKWLIESFGEPAEHQSLANSNVVRKAVTRYCWSELANQNGPRKFLGMPELTLPEWLREQVKMYLGYAKEGQARIVKVQEQQKAFEANFKVMMKALSGDFVIVDIETTGLNVDQTRLLKSVRYWSGLDS
ncbi:MAG: hypothetical protein H0X43_13385 [Nitrosospira sp.]|nr:hypothetical protein [Nitrosospira sp.]